MTIAQVTENAYDTVTGEHLLIPQGTRLIGKYDSVVAFGQKRALLVWNRIILPNGDSIVIDNLPATDAAGYAGLEDEVDFHTWQLLKGIGLATLLGVGTQLALGNTEGDLVRALRESIQQTTNRAGQRLIERQLDVQPTITVRPGWPVRVIVAKGPGIPLAEYQIICRPVDYAEFRVHVLPFRDIFRRVSRHSFGSSRTGRRRVSDEQSMSKEALSACGRGSAGSLS